MRDGKPMTKSYFESVHSDFSFKAPEIYVKVNVDFMLDLIEEIERCHKLPGVDWPEEDAEKEVE